MSKIIKKSKALVLDFFLSPKVYLKLKNLNRLTQKSIESTIGLGGCRYYAFRPLFNSTRVVKCQKILYIYFV
jgi:hypothetical protein